jgi:hypothetical protein
MRTRSIVAFLSLLFSVSCSYSMTPVGIVSPQFVDRPREWERPVQATEWGYMDDIAVGRTLHSMWAQAESMGADDILGIRMENNCYYSLIPYYNYVVHCWAGGTGLAVKYQSKK